MPELFGRWGIACRRRRLARHYLESRNRLGEPAQSTQWHGKADSHDRDFARSQIAGGGRSRRYLAFLGPGKRELGDERLQSEAADCQHYNDAVLSRFIDVGDG